MTSKYKPCFTGCVTVEKETMGFTRQLSMGLFLGQVYARPLSNDFTCVAIVRVANPMRSELRLFGLPDHQSTSETETDYSESKTK